MGGLAVYRISDITGQWYTDRLTTVVVVRIPVKVKIILVFKVSKFLQSDARGDLSPCSHVNALPDDGSIQ
jgi:hypothetical protein